MKYANTDMQIALAQAAVERAWFSQNSRTGKTMTDRSPSDLEIRFTNISCIAAWEETQNNLASAIPSLLAELHLISGWYSCYSDRNANETSILFGPINNGRDAATIVRRIVVPMLERGAEQAPVEIHIEWK